MFARRSLLCGLLFALAAGACTTPVSIDWGNASPTPTPTPDDGGAVTWLSVRQLLPANPIATEAPVGVQWSPVPGVISWRVLLGGIVVGTTTATELVLLDQTLGGSIDVQVLPENALASTPAITVSAIPVNRQTVLPFGRAPGTTLTLGTPSGSCFGKSLTAIDIDGNPGTDLLVGAPWNGLGGSLLPYTSNANGTFSAGTATTSIIQDSRYGWAQAVISAPAAEILQVAVGAPDNAGSIEIWDNDPLGATGVAPASLGSGAHLGYALSALDLDGDDLPELLAGAPRASSNGALVLYPQDGAGLQNPFIAFGFTSGEHLGYSVALAADVIDGLDFAVGGGPFFGAAENGRMTVLSVDLSTGFTGSDGNLVGANGDQLGWSVLAPGDITDDGKADIVAAAPGGDSLQIIRGSDVNDLGQQLLAPETLAKPSVITESFGRSLTAAPDVTFDGIPDFLVGSPQHTAGGQANAGGIALYQGATGFSAALPRWGYSGFQSQSFVGTSAAVGDFDADGYADVAVGAAQCNVFTGTTNGTHEAVHVFYSPPPSGAILTPANDVFAGAPDDSISFDHTLTSLGIGGHAECAWDWDDGNGTEAIQPCAAIDTTHSYPAAGQYEPTLRVESYGLVTVTRFRVVIE